MRGSTIGARRRRWIAARFAAGLTADAAEWLKHARMTDAIDAKLAELGLALPEPAAPVAAYVPAVEAGGLLHISGQLPFKDGALMTGRLGEDRDLDYGAGGGAALRADAGRADQEGAGRRSRAASSGS